MPGVSWRNFASAAVASVAIVLTYFAPWLLSPVLFRPPTLVLSNALIFGIAGAAALLAVSTLCAFPKLDLARTFWATVLVLLSWRLAIFWIGWLARLPLTSSGRYWVYSGPGSGTIGLLPSAILVLLAGRFLFGMSIREQWNGRLAFAWRDLFYGGAVAISAAAFAIGCMAAGGGRVAWEPNWAGHGVNIFSNLWEEILARSLLLQIARREGGNWFAMIWTGIVFASMHGLTWMAVSFAVFTWVIAWVVLRAGSLWAGWVFHQTIDMIVDSLMH